MRVLRHLPAVAAAMTAALWLVAAEDACAASVFRRWGVGLGAGAAVPTGAYTDVLEVGTVVDATGEYFVKPTFSVGLLLGAVSNPPTDAYSPPDFDASARLYRLFFFGRLATPGTGTRLFGDLGIGAVNRRLVLEDPFSPATEELKEERTRFGAVAGVGVQLPLGETTDLLPEVSYLWVPLSEDQVVDASAQNSVLATISLRFRFGD